MNPTAIALYGLLAAWAVLIGLLAGLAWALIPLGIASAVFIVADIL